MTRSEFCRIMASEKFTDAEKRLFEAEFPKYSNQSNFYEKLFFLLHACDLDNLAHMARAFPDEVEAVRCWRSGNLGSRFYAMSKEPV